MLYLDMREICFVILFVGCLATSFVQDTKAQGTVDALTPSIGFYSASIPGYTFGGIGWTFTPTETLLVTAIAAVKGPFPDPPYVPLVSFWSGTNKILSSFSYTNSNSGFELIAPFILLAGQNYSISMQHSNFSSSVNFYLGSPTGADGFTPVISVSPYLSGFGNFQLSTNGQWSPSPAAANADYLFFGPNFQFEVVPEPNTIGLSVLGLSFFIRLMVPRIKHPKCLSFKPNEDRWRFLY